MKRNDLALVGGICAILAGLASATTGATYILLPVEQSPGSIPAEFLASVGQNGSMLMLHYIAFIATALFGLGTIPAISALAPSANAGLLQWVKALAYIGFAVTAISYQRQLEYVPILAARFLEGDELTKALMTGNIMTLAGLDWYGFMRFGGVGLWILVVNLYAWRQGTIPTVLALLGISTALLYWCIVTSFAAGIGLLLMLGAGLGGTLIGPIWYIWMGVHLLREWGATQAAVPQPQLSRG